jgi:transmembrane sensor
LHAVAWARVEAFQRQWTTVPVHAARSSLDAAQTQRREVLKILSVLLAVGGGTWMVGTSLSNYGLLAQQSTGTRERRSLRLEDGSQVELNANTALDVSFDGQLRLVRLYRGEILVQTARDPGQRPFVVETMNGRIHALGTRFSVRQMADLTRVGVLQSAVEIRPRRHPGQVVRLDAGQQAAFDHDRTDPAHALPADSTAWVQGMLSVNEWHLGDFVEELGRYRPGVLRCAEAVRDLSISGAFRIDDTDAVLDNLARTLPVKVRYLTRYWVSIEAV